MSETYQNTLPNSFLDIQIIGLNSDKTHKINHSDNAYNVYFELSGIPSEVWKIIFERDWKSKISGSRSKSSITEIKIDRDFLVIHCALEEVATLHLPALKKAVNAANKEHEQYVQQQGIEHTRRESILKEERKSVHAMAETLHF